jgi:hypothetical protein
MMIKESDMEAFIIGEVKTDAPVFIGDIEQRFILKKDLYNEDKDFETRENLLRFWNCVTKLKKNHALVEINAFMVKKPKILGQHNLFTSD